MFEIKTLSILIPALPLAAAVLIALLGPRLLKRHSHIPAVAAIAAAFVCSVLLVVAVHQQQSAEESGVGAGFEQTVSLWRWADIDEAGSPTVAARDFTIDVTLRADALSALMLGMVTFISGLVAIYSVGYMRGDEGYWRFFAYICLFVFSMTMLVSASNFLILYVFWEAVGLSSYLLIGFWYRRPAAAAAGKKAFLVNRVGDFGLALAVFLIWITYGTLNFHDTPEVAGVLGETRISEQIAYAQGPVAVAICLLLLLGACGKSAQFPLHVWLPDAMEGPTPVSALIHAATMVTAGVYMVARCTPLFMAAPEAQLVVALIGGFTAILAALIAMTQFDLKRILAYSTISQLGYMFLALGAGTLAGVTAGMFHLFTHAFFKALLFLGAGSVMHAMGGVIDVRRFGGLRRRLPVTYWTFLIGCLALAGVFPFAGFWSKDAILAAIHQSGDHQTVLQVLYWIALATAGLTAFYTFRAFLLTFHGAEHIPDEAEGHGHESPWSMTGPLCILAGGSIIAGFFSGPIYEFLETTPSLAYGAVHAAEGAHGSHLEVAIVSTAVAVAGVAVACLLYLGSPALAGGLARLLKWVGLYQLSYGKFFFDPIYMVLVIWPLRGVAVACYWLDRWVVDLVVDLCGQLPRAVGKWMRSLHMGLVQFYALAMILGMLVLITARLLSAGG